MTRLLLLALGAILGYTLRQSPACDREHLPRHRDPAIVDREGDEGIQPPDPQTWRSAPVTLADTAAVTHTVRTWPDTLEHDDQPHVGWSPLGCPRCEGERWPLPSAWLHHRGARPA